MKMALGTQSRQVAKGPSAAIPEPHTKMWSRPGRKNAEFTPKNLELYGMYGFISFY